ncbi:MAG: Gfo/Idh/MocA family protein [Chloroflexota bacterium]
MENGRLGVGLIGAGFAARAHARGYARLADLGVALRAVAGRGGARAGSLAGEYGATSYDDYRELLARDDIAIVDLCVPNDLHEPFALAAIAAGKHVICEKPLTGYFGGPGAAEPVGATPRDTMLAEALASADRMLAAARQRGVRLMYAENWLYAPAVQKARRLIEASGGTVLDIRGAEGHSGSHAAYAKTWHSAGGGALLRLGAHPLGAALYLKWQEGLQRDGKPIRVRAVSAETGDLTRVPSFARENEKWLVVDWHDVENWATVIATFEDGSRATVFAADTVLGGMEDTLDIFMSNGRVKCDMTHSTMLQAYAPAPHIFANEYLAEKLETKAGWSHPAVEEEWLLGYPQEVRDFVEAVLQDREPLGTAELGRDVVRVIYAAYLAAAEGRRVETPLN